MRDLIQRRLVVATLFALAAGAMVWFANPVKQLKTEIRADAQGLVLSLEYTARLIG